MAKRSTKPGPYLFKATLLRDRVKTFTKYPYCLAAVRDLEELEFHPKVTFFVGENGSGKSTLVEAIAVGLGLNAEGGGRNFNFGTRASHSELADSLRLSRSLNRPRDSYFLRAESYFNLATEIERLDKDDAKESYQPKTKIIDSYGGVSLHEQSHGESFMALFENRFRGHGIYVLDEPEAALSPKRQLALLARLHRLILAGSQFVIATHSPMLLAYPDAWIYVLGGAGPARTAYQETDHFLVTRGFLANPARAVESLLGLSGSEGT